MRSDGEWATALEITAVSHLLLRPIHLITDHQDSDCSTTVVEPPQFISLSAWGPTIYLIHFLQWHFEGTTARAASPVHQAELSHEIGAEGEVARCA